MKLDQVLKLVVKSGFVMPDSFIEYPSIATRTVLAYSKIETVSRQFYAMMNKDENGLKPLVENKRLMKSIRARITLAVKHQRDIMNIKTIVDEMAS